jgi:hypothetical protein
MMRQNVPRCNCFIELIQAVVDLAHANQFHSAKNCSETPYAEAAMRVEQLLAAGLHQPGRTDIAGTALLQVIRVWLL